MTGTSKQTPHCIVFTAMKMGPPARNQLFDTFCAAFADYYLDASYMTEETLHLRTVKNAVDWDLSVGAFEDHRMVGFTMIGVDEWRDELAAFDVMTGIVPQYRNQGLAGRMFEHALPRLERRGVSRFVLEVLQPNEPAIRSYSRSGFEITRELHCYELDLQRVPASRLAAPPGYTIRSAELAQLGTLEDHLEWMPSWENSLASMRRIPSEVTLFAAYAENGGACIGAVAYLERFNWITTLVVHREQRRQGLGTALLHHLAHHLTALRPTVRMINVDDDDKILQRLVEGMGFERFVSQYEMELRIGSSC